MGFEALFGECEHCKADPNVSKETEVIDIFIHKRLGFPHFEYRTRICKACLERYETTDELFDQLNSEVNQILVVFLEREDQYKILTKQTKQGEKVAQ